MKKNENYRYTEDGVLLVRKQESGKAGGFGAIFDSREMWYQCSEKDSDRQYLQVVLGGWFGLHKFMEGCRLQGLCYFLTCGFFGVFYLYDLFSLLCGNYYYKRVSYVDNGWEVERRMQKIYYGPLSYKKRAMYLFLLAVVILMLAVGFVYQPIGKGLMEWLAAVASGLVTKETVEQLQEGLIGRSSLWTVWK